MDSTRDRILAEARELYAREGLAGLSMRKVAGRLDLSATAIYRHFRDKEALLLRMVEESFQVFASYLVRALSEATPRARFDRTVRAYHDFALDNPNDYGLLFMSSAKHWGLSHVPEDKGAQFRATFQLLVDRIEECMDACVMQRRDPEQTALLVWAHGHGLASLWMTELRHQMTEADYRNLIEVSLEQLWRALEA